MRQVIEMCSKYLPTQSPYYRHLRSFDCVCQFWSLNFIAQKGTRMCTREPEVRIEKRGTQVLPEFCRAICGCEFASDNRTAQGLTVVLDWTTAGTT